MFMGDNDGVTFNGPVSALAKVTKHVMTGAAEAEAIALFMNAQDSVPLRPCLEELGHAQSATPINTDNSTAAGTANNDLKQKRRKSILTTQFVKYKNRLKILVDIEVREVCNNYRI